jgi:hypothetical protein
MCNLSISTFYVISLHGPVDKGFFFYKTLTFFHDAYFAEIIASECSVALNELHKHTDTIWGLFVIRDDCQSAHYNCVVISSSSNRKVLCQMVHLQE